MAAARSPAPARLKAGLQTLRVQVSLALLVGAALCAYVAGDSSGDELAGAYRDGGRGLLLAAGESLRQDLVRPGPGESLQHRTEQAAALHRNILGASVWGRRGGRTVVLASTRAGERGRPVGARAAQLAAGRAPVQRELRTGGKHVAELLLPLPANPQGATVLRLDYDLGPYDAALADRSRRLALVLTALLLGFTAFTALVLGRRIFRPLHRLRLTTHRIRSGELGSRLNWTRRDELGVLARDFDEMARGLEHRDAQLRVLALEDPLTGLANHRHFQEILAERLKEAERDGTPLSLVVVDIDNFKGVNDARGHTFGDEVLTEVGTRLRRALDGHGYPARLGGDEFAVVLPRTDGPQALILAEAARAGVQEAELRGVRLSCSAGIACFPDDARHGPALLQLADGALYWAKHSGRAQTRRYDPEHVLVVTDEQRAVIDDVVSRPGAIKPVFQPWVRLATGRVAGYEALARFATEDVRPPSWWFAQAHRFGLGARLEAEAVRAALAARGRPAGTFLSLNLSLSAVMDHEVRSGLPEDLTGIVIEITEHEQISDERALQEALRPLRTRGARIAIDDAGAGYAGLQQVMRIGAEIIKLDRALVQGVHADRAKRALVESFVSFAASTNAEVCAEGVGSLDELQVLAEIGVTYGQGYAVARPGPPWPGAGEAVEPVCRAGRGAANLRVVSLEGRRAGSTGAASS